MIVNSLGDIASFIGSLTVVGGALLWVWNTFVGSPREKRRLRQQEKDNQRLADLLDEQKQPLLEAIESLNQATSRNNARDEKLQEIADRNVELLEDHENRLDNHNERLIVLEVNRGINSGHKQVSYVEQHGNNEKGGD